MADNKAQIVLSAKDETAAAFAKAKAGLLELRAAAASSAGVFGTLGVAVIAAFEAVSVKGAIDAADELSKLEQKTGIAVEALSALKYAGTLSDVSVQDLAVGIKKLGNSMAEAAGGGKDAIATFAAIGVSVKSSTGALRGTDDVLADIADKFAGYEDGAGKAALATALFGKNGAQLIPFLNAGRKGLAEMKQEAEKLGVIIGGDLAKQAEAFNDDLTRLGAAAEAGKIALAEVLLPALVRISEEFIEARKAYGSFWRGFLDAGRGSTADGDLANTRVKIDELTASLTELEVKQQKAKDNPNAPFVPPDHIRQLKDEIKLLKQRKEFQEALQRRDALANGEGVADERRFKAPPKVAAPVIDKTTNKDEGLSQLNALLDKIKERSEADKIQLSLNRQLTESEKFAVDVETALSGAKSKLSASQKEVVRQRLADVKALDRQLETRALLRAAADADSKAEQDTLDLIAQQTDARLQENRSLADQLQLFGMNTREAEAYRLKQLEIALAVEQAAIAEAKALGAGDGTLIALRDKAALLQKQIDLRTQLAAKTAQSEDDPLAGAQRALKTYAEGLAKAGTDTEKFVTDSLNSLETGVTDALTGKTVDARQIVDQIIAEFIRLRVVKPLLADIFGSTGTNGSGAGVIGSIIGLFGGFKAAGGSVTAGVPVMTGERGRELFVPQVDGTIVPNSALQGGGEAFVFHQTLNVGQGVSRSEVAAALQASNRQLKSEILRSKRRAGAFE